MTTRQNRGTTSVVCTLASAALAGCTTCCPSPSPASPSPATRWTSAATPPTSPVAAPPASAPAPAFDRDIERRAVMRVVLTERYGEVEGRAKRFVLDPRPGSSINELDDRKIARLREIGSKFVEPIALPDGRRASRPHIDGLEAAMVADWATHTRPSPTPRDLNLLLPVDWFTEADWAALKPVVVTGEDVHNDPAPKWTRFHATHPDSAGWIRLTDVGFTPDGGRALIYVVRAAGAAGGSGRWFVLEKRDGRWVIAQPSLAWIS